MRKFEPRPGQIDYTSARWTPVINCVAKYKDKILIVQRSAKINFYPEYWNGVSGFLDNHKSLNQKVEEELKEELNIRKEDIISIHFGEIFDQEEPKYDKTWIVHPVLAELATDEISIDWEAQKYKWIKIEEAKEYKLLPGFDMVLEKLFSR